MRLNKLDMDDVDWNMVDEWMVSSLSNQVDFAITQRGLLSKATTMAIGDSIMK